MSDTPRMTEQHVLAAAMIVKNVRQFYATQKGCGFANWWMEECRAKVEAAEFAERMINDSAFGRLATYNPETQFVGSRKGAKKILDAMESNMSHGDTLATIREIVTRWLSGSPDGAKK